MSVSFCLARLFRHTARCLLLAMALPSLSLQAAVITVGPAGDPDCQHTSLQAAINAAAATPGLDILRLAAGTYTGQRLTITDSSDLAIEGGFVSCGLLVVAGTSTLDGQSANPAGPVIGHYGSGRLTLARLVVRNGNATSAAADSGGGIDSNGPGALTLRELLVHSNRAQLGGGIAVTGPVPAGKSVDLDGVGVNSNIATLSGGGLYALNAVVSIGGTGINYFAGNFSQGTMSNHGGGAVFAANSDVFIHSLPPAQSPFMDSNLAESYGGAVYFVNYGGGTRYLWLRNRDGQRPLVVANNAADRGGAFFLASNANSTASYTAISATFTDSILDNNDALDGGTLYLQANGDGPIGLTAVAMAAAEGNLACPAHLRCNRISGSQSHGNGTAYLLNQGTTGTSRLRLLRGHLVDNFAPGDSVVGGNGIVEANNTIVADNVSGQAGLFSGSDISLQNSTVAGNTIAGPRLITLHGPVGSFPLMTGQNSILHQPGKLLIASHSTGSYLWRNLVVGSGHGLLNTGGLNVIEAADPGFVNAGGGDYRLAPGSVAVNRYGAGGGVVLPTLDLFGGSRPVAPAGNATPYDIGAHELGSVVDTVFADGFDQN